MNPMMFHSAHIRRQAQVIALLPGGLLSAAAHAESLCRNPGDQSRADTLYSQAQQQPGTDQAVQWLNESVALCPGMFQSRYALADNLLQLKRYALADNLLQLKRYAGAESAANPGRTGTAHP